MFAPERAKLNERLLMPGLHGSRSSACEDLGIVGSSPIDHETCGLSAPATSTEPPALSESPSCAIDCGSGLRHERSTRPSPVATRRPVTASIGGAVGVAVVRTTSDRPIERETQAA